MSLALGGNADQNDVGGNADRNDAAADTAALPRPAERVAIVSLVLVFLCGALMGAVLMRITGRARVATVAPSGISMSAPNMAEWKKQLDLTDDQTARLTSVLDDFSRYYDNVLADGNSRIMQILNPDQRRRFEQMLRDRKP